MHDGRRRRLDVLRIQQTGDRTKAGGRLADRECTRVRGDLATGSREAVSEVEPAFALALCVGRRGAVPLVGESPRVEHRKLDSGGGVCEEELVVRSVEVDAERELLDPLGYGEGRDLEQDA